MGGRLRGHSGGIRSLGELIQQHPGELRHLLVTNGLRWRDHGRTWDWADLAVLVRFAPREAPIHARLSTQEEWTRTEHMLADLFDAIRLLTFVQQRGHGTKPKPYPRPGDRSVQRFGRAVRMTRDEARAARDRSRKGEGVRDVGEADAVR